MYSSLFQKKISVLVVSVLFTNLLPVVAVAQAMVDYSTDNTTSPTLPVGAVSCFDYYTFGSVQADISTEMSTVVSGAPVIFSGVLENTNPYPVVDGTLYVKIFRERSAGKDVDGPDVVDQFVAVNGVAIPAKSKVPVSFVWSVPSGTVSGTYQAAMFFLTSRKSNVMGLSFTDDVVGNLIPFTVQGEVRGGVGFEKQHVTVDGSPYHFAAAPPITSTSDPVVVQAHIGNTTNAAVRVRVLWTVYQWDAQLRENVLQEEEQSVDVPAGETVPASITVKDTAYPVYLVQGIVTWGDTKSVIGVRFVRPGVERIRINFPSIMSYPLVAGTENTLFSCLNNTGEATIVKGGRLELTLSDAFGDPIHTYTYQGDVTGAMMAVKDSFIPTKNYERFTLSARLYQNDEFVDEATLSYDCNQLNPRECPPDINEPTRIQFVDMVSHYMGLAVGFLAFLFFVAGLVVLIRRSRSEVIMN
jgi:hypothetical protein